METFNNDPKPGRLVLPLVLIGMIATTYTFINRVATNNNLDIEPVTVDSQVIDDEEELPVEDSTTTSTTTTSTSTTTSTTTTIPTTTTTVEVSPEKDSVTINDNNPVDPTPYEGVYAAFEGFEGENQTLLDSLVQNLPEVYKETLLEKISFINGCHLYGVEMLGECPFGVWDSAGTFKNGDTNADWKLSVWVSNRAFRSNRAFDTLLHESSHAFSYLNRNCVAPDGTNKRQQAQEYFGSEELFADSLVLYFGGDYVFYRETNSLSDAENAYLQEFINLCT